VPKIEDLLASKPKKVFKKTSYKPWESTFIETNNEIGKDSYVSDKKEDKDKKQESFSSLDKEGDYTFEDFFRLKQVIGKHRKVLFFLANKEMQRDESYVICEPISSIEIANELGEDVKYIRNILQRLNKMKAVKTLKTKKGPAGYSIHGIPLSLVKEIEKAKGLST